MPELIDRVTPLFHEGVDHLQRLRLVQRRPFSTSWFISAAFSIRSGASDA